MIYTIEITNRSGSVEFHVDTKGTALEKKQEKMKKVTEALNNFLTRLGELEKEV
ncbi:MAG: hypothetical protein IJR68_04625 [Fretibacterium sp.]|nr:hypothetical protein [Fretibacterium sp.]